MAGPGDETIFSSETDVPAGDESVRLRGQVDALSRQVRELWRKNDQAEFYVKDLEEKNQEYQKLITARESDIHSRDLQITTLREHAVNYEAELEGLHAGSNEATARVGQLREELALVKETARSDRLSLERLAPMLEDFFSENLQRVDELFDTRVLRDDAQVEVRALEGDLRAAAVDHEQMHALTIQLDDVMQQRDRLRDRFDVVQRHFPGTASMEAGDLDDFLTDFRRERSTSSTCKASAARKYSSKLRGSKEPAAGRQSYRKISLADELAGLGNDATDETVGPSSKTSDAVLAPGGISAGPGRPTAATGEAGDFGKRLATPTGQGAVVFALSNAGKWWAALLAAVAALTFFVAGYWCGDYSWSNANGYAPHDRYLHVDRGLAAFFIQGSGGVLLWFLGLFCDPVRLFESWAQFAYADVPMPG